MLINFGAKNLIKENNYEEISEKESNTEFRKANNMLELLAQYSTGSSPPFIVPFIGFLILLLLACRFFGPLGFFAWLITVFIYMSGCMGS